MTKGKQLASDIVKVKQAIDDHIAESHHLPDVSYIEEITELSRHRCKSALQEMIKRKKITVAYEGEGNPKIYIPTVLMQEILRKQPKPEWLGDYELSEKEGFNAELEAVRSQIHELEFFERLLYATGTPLEEAVAVTLNYLGFDDVIHHTPRNSDYADITFHYNGKMYLVEVVGTSRQADKTKVLQLDGWLRAEIDQTGQEPDNLVGLLIVNHYRHQDPKTRNAPITPIAEKFLKHYRFKQITTTSLFEHAKDVRLERRDKNSVQAALLR